MGGQLVANNSNPNARRKGEIRCRIFPVLLLFLSLISLKTYAQVNLEGNNFDPTSQELLPDLLLNLYPAVFQNPAFEGLEKRKNARISYDFIQNDSNITRIQVVNQRGQKLPYSLYGSFSYPFINKRLNAGLSVFKSMSGVIEERVPGLIISYALLAGKDYQFRLGFSANYIQNIFHSEWSTFTDQIDSINGFIHKSREALPGARFKTTAKMNFNLGGFFAQDPLYMGFYASNLNRPAVAFLNNSVGNSFLSLHYFIAYRLYYNDNICLLPALNTHFYQQGYLLFESSINLNYANRFLFGFEYITSTLNPVCFKYALGLNFRRNLVLSVNMKSSARKSLREAGMRQEIGLGLLYQFGRTKKNLSKWRNYW